MRRFRLGEVWVLITTDVLGRGVDFKGVNMVVNYDLPPSATSYVHRIGRTGRAGRAGEAVTFFTEHDMVALRPIANVAKLSGCEVPAWMLALKKERPDERKRRETGPAPERHRISTESGYDRDRRHKKRSMIEKSKRDKDERAKFAAKPAAAVAGGILKKAKKAKKGGVSWGAGTQDHVAGGDFDTRVMG